MARIPPFTVLCLSFAATLSSARQIKFRNPEHEKTCSDNKCGNTSYDTILKWYSRILLTIVEHEEIQLQLNISRDEFLEKQDYTQKKIASEYGDGDSCCATSISYKLNYTLTNIWGHEKTIVHMPDAVPPRYQFIPHAECLVQHQNCDGACLIEPILLTLLVLQDEDLVFDFFQIPGYCSCKNISI